LATQPITKRKSSPYQLRVKNTNIFRDSDGSIPDIQIYIYFFPPISPLWYLTVISPGETVD